MTRRPLFWVAFVALGLAGAGTGVSLFETALPSISLDVSMDREGAISEARALGERAGWPPADARAAASFGQVDAELQTYVELEGGGREAFQGLVDADVYHGYQWRVRLFAEGEVAESEVRFTPAGQPYGFRTRLSEDDPGEGNLDQSAARSLAESEAAGWAVDLAPFSLIEASQQTRPGGRVDHTFVYERADVGAGDARFRLRLEVAGNELAQLTRFAFVPEAFSRRYADMRSTNDTIALVAQGIFILLYVLCGAGVGTALLLRERWIEWRTPMVWGTVVAVLFGLNSVNSLPLAWMGYDTALSARTFVFQNLAASLAIVVLGAPLLGFFFMAGESLGRRAFPGHVQQWRFWSPEVAASRSALGLTVAAYVLVGIQVGYVVLFYLGTSRLDGWWSPADALVQPDLLATYQPWVQAVSISLFASLWEESIFRAVPIACAAIIGARLGRRNLWIWGAVILQAVVFAAGHANYPQQPPYARVVELTFPALAWGAVYVFFGLVPTILAHFLYDLALISSVLFASDAPFDQAVIVAVAAVPLLIVLRARRRSPGVDRFPAWAFNRAWAPSPPSADHPSPEIGSDGASGADPTDPAGKDPAPGPSSTTGDSDERDWAPEGDARTRGGARLPSWAVATAGLVGLLLWLVPTMRRDVPPRMEPTRSEAIEIARAELGARGFDIRGRSVLARTASGRGVEHEYVWEEVGREAMERLEGTFLPPPQWVVRFVDWQASPEDRVEEYVVNVAADGSIRRVAHSLPEGRSGPVLEVDSARVLARAALPPGAWEEVGAEENAHESRTDWSFTFRDPSVLTSVAAEGRAAVTVLGSEVTNLRRYVDIPEEWERDRRSTRTRLSTIGIGLAFVLVLLYGAAAITAIVVWSRGGLVTTPVWKVGAVTAVAMSASLANGWPSTAAGFVTSQPFGFQVGGVVFGLLLVTLVSAAALALVAALAVTWAEGRAAANHVDGIALGLVLAGGGRMASWVAGGMPGLPDYTGAGAFVPALVPVVDVIPPVLFASSALAILAVAHRRFRGSPTLRGTTAFVILAVGIVAVPEALRETLPTWFGTGLLGAALFGVIVHLLGRMPSAAPTAVATFFALSALDNMVDAPWPGARAGALMSVLVIAAIAWGWTRWWAPSPRAPQPVP